MVNHGKNKRSLLRAAGSLPVLLFFCGFSVTGGVGSGAALRSPGDSVPEGYAGYDLVRYYYTEGIKSYKIDSDADKAVGFFDLAIAADSSHAPSYYQAATALVTVNSASALEYGRRAVELDSTNAWYSNLYGRLLIFNGKYGQARRIYEKLIVMEPRNPEHYAMLAMLYEQMGQPYAAIAVLDRAENSVGKIEQLSRHKRDMLVAAGLTDQAIEEAHGIVEAYPYDYEGYLALAELYAELRKDSLALENYRMASALNPEGLDVIGSMNEFYRITGDTEKYLTTAKKLMQSPGITKEIKQKIFKDITADRSFYRENYFYIRDIASTLFLMYPDDYDIVSLYAGNILAWGDFEEALEVHKGYIATPREEVEPYMDVINMEAYKQRHDSVKKYIEVALERFPSDPALYIRMGGTLSYMERHKEALKAFDQALKYAEEDSARSVIYGVIGDEFHTRGQDKKSYKYYEKALRLWDGNTLVLNNYAYFLSEQDQQLEKALDMARRVMEQVPSNPSYIDTYGWILFKMGRLEEAKAAVRQALTLDNRNSSELLIHYGDILYGLGEEYMATVYWKRALEAGHDEEEINHRLEKAGR